MDCNQLTLKVCRQLCNLQTKTVDFTFELEGRGDHLLEWFSDAAASYTLIVDLAFERTEDG